MYCCLCPRQDRVDSAEQRTTDGSMDGMAGWLVWWVRLRSRSQCGDGDGDGDNNDAPTKLRVKADGRLRAMAIERGVFDARGDCGGCCVFRL